MPRVRNKGLMINIDLYEYGYKGYSVDCLYIYDKREDKYSLSMWLRKRYIDSRFGIDSDKIDKQYVSSTKENIRDDIIGIVDTAATSGFFDYYIDRFEYMLKCFDKGDEFFEAENADKE